MLDHYLNKLDYKNIPDFLKKYLDCPSLIRLKKVGYFCGMDYASKNIYDFGEYISRYDHSLTVALLTYKLTKDKNSTLAALFHDIATPCFSHVIDYMNKDYEKQESTEEYTGSILRKDDYLTKCLSVDKIDIEDIINFKKYTIVDNARPKLCADRLDGVILSGYFCTKNLTIKDIDETINSICIYKNEYGEDEIGFTSPVIAKRIIDVSNSIDAYFHSSEDNYMMELLAKTTKLAIDNKIITYDELYKSDEEKLFNTLKRCNNEEVKNLLHTFKTIKKESIPKTIIPNIKVRDLKPIVDGVRL